MGPNFDSGEDIESPELAAAISAGWWLMRQWNISEGEVRLVLQIKRKRPGDASTGWMAYERAYTGTEIEMLTVDIVRGHVRELAQRAMQENPPAQVEPDGL